jgi:hypothetical protein
LLVHAAVYFARCAGLVAYTLHARASGRCPASTNRTALLLDRLDVAAIGVLAGCSLQVACHMAGLARLPVTSVRIPPTSHRILTHYITLN